MRTVFIISVWGKSLSRPTGGSILRDLITITSKRVNPGECSPHFPFGCTSSVSALSKHVRSGLFGRPVVILVAVCKNAYARVSYCGYFPEFLLPAPRKTPDKVGDDPEDSQ